MGKGQKKGKTMSLQEFTADAVQNDPTALPTAPREDSGWAVALFARHLAKPLVVLRAGRSGVLSVRQDGWGLCVGHVWVWQQHLWAAGPACIRLSL